MKSHTPKSEVAEVEASKAHGPRRFVSRRNGLFTVAGLSLLLAGCGDRHLSTMDPESPIAEKLDTFLVWLLVAAGVVFVLVQGAILYMAKRFRVKAPEDESQVYPDEEFPDQVHGNTRLEIGWTILPTVIMAVIAFFTLGLLFELDDVSANDDRQIQEVVVVGQQWWWEFQYHLDDDGVPDIVTANELVLPVGEEIRLRVTSRDVIHSFWVPTLNGKRDAVPGRYNPWTIEAGNAGRFPGECTEFCGLSHAYMEKFAVGIPLDEWQEWAATQQLAAALPEEGTSEFAGWEVFNNQCASCHVINGLTSHYEDGSIDDFALYSNLRVGESGLDAVLDQPPVRYIEKQTQVSGAAPNLTHLQSRSTFAGGIFELYKNPDSENYIDLASEGTLNRGALEAWIVNAPEVKANAWDSPSGQRGMTPFTALSAEDVDNLVEFLTNMTYAEGNE
ncbi:MAG: cytochrome c oxidase subunit 2 [Acidimicrobiales bacterium]|jgi:cytochrome c oxidase subunit 2